MSYFDYLAEHITIVPRIKEIEIKDKGIIKKANIKFKDGLNIIIGPNRSGKTTVIEAIRENSEKAMNSIDLLCSLSCGSNIKFLFGGILDIIPPKSCLLIDDLLGRLDYQKRKNLLRELQNSGNQIIITSLDDLEIKKIRTNLIETKSFELKR